MQKLATLRAMLLQPQKLGENLDMVQRVTDHLNENPLNGGDTGLSEILQEYINRKHAMTVKDKDTLRDKDTLETSNLI